jgi:hypothetical protein
MPLKKWSAITTQTIIALSDKIMGLVSSNNASYTIDTLRLLLQSSFTQLVISGKITANEIESVTHLEAATLEGNGALITGVIAAGVGGASSTGSLSVVCNSDGSTAGAVIAFSKNGVPIGEFDEVSLRLATGIAYSHDDDSIPFAKDLNLQGKELLNQKQSQTCRSVLIFILMVFHLRLSFLIILTLSRGRMITVYFSG